LSGSSLLDLEQTAPQRADMQIDIPDTLHERIEELRSLGGNAFPYNEFVVALLHRAIESYEMVVDELSYDDFKVIPDPTMPEGQVHMYMNGQLMKIVNLAEAEEGGDVHAESPDGTVKFTMRLDQRTGNFVVVPADG
jgi:hypothetical protein